MTSAERHKLFLELLEEHRPRILRLCRAYLSSSQEVDDLFQEIMVNVWRSLDSFRHEAKITTWLYRVAVNTALLYRRSLARAETLGGRATGQEMPDVPSRPEPAIDEDERLMTLRRAIAALAAEDRLLVTLLLEELSYKEMAEITGITVNYVGVKISRIKQTLEKLMREPSHGRT
jgi:RNA polymerase sigma-70 factor (ECF subfamily)